MKTNKKTISEKTTTTFDRFGRPIPAHLVPVFADTKLGEILGKLKEVNGMVARGRADIDPAFAKVSIRASLYLEGAYGEIEGALPFCVCPVCKGEGCPACGRAGYQNEEQYERLPKELR